jgi:hypothetical protein
MQENTSKSKKWSFRTLRLDGLQMGSGRKSQRSNICSLEQASRRQPQRGKFYGAKCTRPDNHLLGPDDTQYKSEMSDFWLISPEFPPLNMIFLYGFHRKKPLIYENPSLEPQI